MVDPAPGPARVKICGLSEPGTVSAAVDAGVAYVGFVFFARSPRYVTPDRARSLAGLVPAGVVKVALVVDPTDSDLDTLIETVPLDMIQLHGAEPPARVAQVRARTGLPVMKALGVAEAADLAGIAAYGAVADQLLIDAKPPKGAARPGGHGLPFDWSLLHGISWPRPWLLAGGLTPANVAEAVRLTGAAQVDVSSGVERAPGVKDAGLIADFLGALATG